MLPTLLSQLNDSAIIILMSGALSVALGTPLGILHGFSRKNNHKIIYHGSNSIMQIICYLPYVIFAGAILMSANIVIALTITATPVFARQLSNSIMKIPTALWDHGKIFGASKIKILRYIIWPNISHDFLGCIAIMLLLLINLGFIAVLLQ